LVRDKKTFKREYRWLLPGAIAGSRAKLPDKVEDLQRRFAEIFARYWRIFCVSRICNSILMWSHYADKHKGLVVGFDTSHPNLASWSKGACFDVEYVAEKADFDLDFECSDVSAFRARLSVVARRKSPEWAYEKEVRFMLPPPDDGGVLFSIEPGAITRVILGARAPQRLRAEVCAILSRPHFSHVVLERATLSKDRFELDFVPVRRGVGATPCRIDASVERGDSLAMKVQVNHEALREFCRQRGIARLDLFGSALREDFRDDSDVDLLCSLRADAQCGLFGWVALKLGLEQLFGRPVDLVSRQGIERSRNPYRRAAILKTAVPLYVEG